MLVRNLPYIREIDPKLYEAFQDIIAGVKRAAQQTNASTSGVTPQPPPVKSVIVTAKDGIHDVVITDPTPIYRDIHYFLEYSPDPGFSNPSVIHLGTTRTWRGMLGNQSLYWRAYSQYPTSAPSTPVYHGGGTAGQVVGGGTLKGPPLQVSTGSGTSNGAGGEGFGKQPYRSINGQAPIRA